jgi:hypothetical protein
MDQHPASWLSAPHRHEQGLQNEVRCLTALDGPADNTPRVQVDDDSQIFNSSPETSLVQFLKLPDQCQLLTTALALIRQQQTVQLLLTWHHHWQRLSLKFVMKLCHLTAQNLEQQMQIPGDLQGRPIQCKMFPPNPSNRFHAHRLHPACSIQKQAV